MNVSVIICTRNRAEYLRATLKSLANVNVPTGMAGELLVADNGSEDDTRRVVEEAAGLTNLPVRYLYESAPGKSHSMNTALREASGDILLFTDDDLRLPLHWIQSMCQPILSGQADAVAGSIKMAPHLERPWMENTHRCWLAETGQSAPGEGICLVGANMAFSRHVLVKVPAFDSNLGPGGLGFGEDTLFSRQIEAAGYRITFQKDACVEHHFQTERLARTSFLTHTMRLAASDAYIAHHWKHLRITAMEARIVQKASQLLLWRLSHLSSSSEAEGLPVGEMAHIYNLHFNLNFLRERNKPRLYQPFGLTKIS